MHSQSHTESMMDPANYLEKNRTRSRNPVARHANQFNRPSTHPSKQDRARQRRPKYGFQFDRELV